MKTIPHKVKGFTLLEAVVALAIFSVGAVAIYAGVNTNLIALDRVHEINKKANAIDTAIDFMGTVNIQRTPSGNSRIGELSIAWEAAPAAYDSDAKDEQENITVNRVNLRETAITLSREGEVISEFTLTLFGIYQVRNPEDAIFN